MSALCEVYLKAETLKTLLDVVTKKGEKGVKLTLSINDETNQYGQNVSSFVSQTEEQRKAKKEKFYTGNGKVFWTNGAIKTAEKQEVVNQSTPEKQPEAEDDLPF